MDDLGRRIQRLIVPRSEERLRKRRQQPIELPDRILRGAIAIFVVGISGLLVRYLISTRPPDFVVLQVCFFCFQLGVITWFIVTFARRRLPSVQIPLRLGRGECAGCLYELAGLPTEAIEHLDFAVRCPECGAVWRSERVRKPAKSGNKKPRGGPGA